MEKSKTLKFFYGVPGKYIDVTKSVMNNHVTDGVVKLPKNDCELAKVLTDPIFGVVKHLIVKNDEGYERIYHNNSEKNILLDLTLVDESRDIKVISLGGVGGCPTTWAIQKSSYNQGRYPYDWIISSQSFVINSFMNISKFFDFDDLSLVEGTALLTKTRDAKSIHDFQNYELEQQNVKDRYRRRYQRLQMVMESSSPILFIRMIDHEPPHIHPCGTFLHEDESIERWIDFVEKLSEKFNKKMFLLIMTLDKLEIQENLHRESKTVFIRYIPADKSGILEHLNSVLEEIDPRTNDV